jgi:hypothetical protein
MHMSESVLNGSFDIVAIHDSNKTRRKRSIEIKIRICRKCEEKSKTSAGPKREISMFLDLFCQSVSQTPMSLTIIRPGPCCPRVQSHPRKTFLLVPWSPVCAVLENDHFVEAALLAEQSEAG